LTHNLFIRSSPNNNAYCQDNEISWYDWGSADTTLLEFVRRLIQLRKQHPVFRRRKWFQGRPIHGAKVTDIGWFTPDGKEMAEEQWGEGFAKALGVFLNGEGIDSPDARGERVVDQSFYVLFNAPMSPCRSFYRREIGVKNGSSCWIPISRSLKKKSSATNRETKSRWSHAP
jgi:pullulanase/glycogen debranching enzyme